MSRVTAWRLRDLLFYTSGGGSIHHVAIYLGNDLVIHAREGATVEKVKVSAVGTVVDAGRLRVP